MGLVIGKVLANSVVLYTLYPPPVPLVTHGHDGPPPHHPTTLPPVASLLPPPPNPSIPPLHVPPLLQHCLPSAAPPPPLEHLLHARVAPPTTPNPNFRGVAPPVPPPAPPLNPPLSRVPPSSPLPSNPTTMNLMWEGVICKSLCFGKQPHDGYIVSAFVMDRSLVL
jgi:hypothetical protein